MTNEEFRERLKSISAMGGDTEELVQGLSELQAEFEKVNVPPQYTESDVKAGDGETWKDKYENMKTRYRERFFNGDGSEPPEPKRNETPPACSIDYKDLFGGN